MNNKYISHVAVSRKGIAIVCALVLMCLSTVSQAQVNDIKTSSSSNKSRGTERASGSAAAGFIYFFGDIFIRGMANWQINTLQNRGEVPNVLSLEVYGQASIQPATYYVFNPRVRGNWGIFFTDFRMNYMVEERIDGVADLGTDDWQIIGLNLVNTRNVTARISTGIMHEAFGDNAVFNESVFGLSIMRGDQGIGGIGEFRWSRDYLTGANPRIEGSIALQKKLFDRNHIHMFATGGATFQRYYNEINVWGLQGGLAFKLY
jgi:hypothetical protein